MFNLVLKRERRLIRISVYEKINKVFTFYYLSSTQVKFLFPIKDARYGNPLS